MKNEKSRDGGGGGPLCLFDCTNLRFGFDYKKG